MVDAAGGGRLHLVATDRPMDQGAEMSTFDSRRLDSANSRLRADLAGERACIKEPPLLDAGHQFETTGGQSESLVDRSQLLLDRGGGDDMRRQRAGDRLDTDMLVSHVRSADRSGCLVGGLRRATPEMKTSRMHEGIRDAGDHVVEDHTRAGALVEVPVSIASM